MTTEKILGLWMLPSGIEIFEVEYNSDMYAFKVSVDGRHVVTIFPVTPEDTEAVKAGLDADEDVRDWEDRNGNRLGTLIRQRTTGLRETLRELEGAGACYNGEIFDDGRGTCWVDRVHSIIYEYETEDPDLLVDDLTDEDLKDIIIRGL